jgi:hypothetical protein
MLVPQEMISGTLGMPAEQRLNPIFEDFAKPGMNPPS